ncbi:MFS transporter [Carboxydocella sp. ULO1]|uniref:MFS transporter n=1 Tax=Carboxydocella sp. ULO1 TaxID=1926599 RepID=UPI0009AF0D8C|nr:MFS transporter [Carboxydocella sp. ULO1]GAW30121.1 arabinose ABC transporter permease [Carboxydocella sp. ULO1]
MQKKILFLTSILNFLLNTAIQGSVIFIPLLGQKLGATDFQVGLIGAAYGGAYLVASLASGQQSDRRGKLIFVRWGLFFSTLMFLAQLLAQRYLVLLLVRAGVGLALGVTTAALVAYAFEAGADMGKFSSYGSLGWIGGAATAAVLKRFELIFLSGAFFCALSWLLSLYLPPGEQQIGKKVEKDSSGWLKVLRREYKVYLAIFLRQLGAAAVWIILPLYFNSLGLSPTWTGILWGINFTVQFLVMRHLNHYDPVKIFAFGQILSIFVFLTYGLVTRLELLILAQILLGIAWSGLYVGALLLVLSSGQERGTASGLFTATLNLCGTLGPFLGGLVAQFWGYRGVMFLAAALSAAGMLVAVPQAVKGEKERERVGDRNEGKLTDLARRL